MAEESRDQKPIIYSDFSGGKRNIDNPTEFGQDELEEALNVDINKQGKALMRSGFGTAVLTGAWKSLWNDGFIILGVRNGDLVQVIPGTTYSYKIIRANVGHLDMMFVKLKDKIFHNSYRIHYSNGVVGGYIKEDMMSYSYPIPTTMFKKPIPPGQLLEIHNGTLYVAIQDIILYSDAYGTLIYDERNAPLRCSGTIVTMLSRVPSGLFIGSDTTTYYRAGSYPPLKSVIVDNHGVLPGSPSKFQNLIVNDQFVKNGVFWVSTEGYIWMGIDGGETVNLKIGKYKISGATKAAGAVITGTINQYKVIIK